jgi:hypothetical protein
MSRAHSLRRTFDVRRRAYDRAVSDTGGLSIVETDVQRLDREVAAMDWSYAERTAEHVGARLDARAVVVVTLVAALAGALAGVIASRI